MPTNQTRHRCIICGCRRVEKYMKVQRYRRFSNIAVWICDTSKLNVLINKTCGRHIAAENGHPWSSNK